MLKKSKVVLFLSPYKFGQAGNFRTLLQKFCVLSTRHIYEFFFLRFALQMLLFGIALNDWPL